MWVKVFQDVLIFLMDVLCEFLIDMFLMRNKETESIRNQEVLN